MSDDDVEAMHMLSWMAMLLGHAPVSTAEDGNTELITPITEGQGPRVAALLAAGADVSAANKLGETPLICAAQHGHVALNFVLALLAAGADVDAVDMQRFTALMWAAMQGREACLLALLAGCRCERSQQEWLHTVDICI